MSPPSPARVHVPPFRTLRSPAFETSYPGIRNPDLIGDHLRRQLNETWSTGVFEERPIEVFRLRDVFVIDECMVLDSELRLISNASDPCSDEELLRAGDRIRAAQANQRLPCFVELGIMASRRATNNYGHFLIEMLPMAYLAAELFGAEEQKFYMHRADVAMMDVVLRAFRMLGHSLQKLVYRGFGEPVHFDELVVVRGLTQHGTYMSPRALDAATALAQAVPPGSDRRIFVRRMPGWRRGRSLVNEAALCERLQAMGYRIVDPGAMSLEAQIALFSGADDVIGVIGAAMTNIVFCRPGTRITMLVPSHFPDTFFWFLAQHRGLDYSELRCEQPAQEGRERSASDFRLSEADMDWLTGTAGPSGTIPDHAPMVAPVQRVVAHIGNIGDVAGSMERWTGEPGSGRQIEGLAIDSPTGEPEIAYRVVFGREWISPWARDGRFLGSRGFALPLHGIGVRLTGAAAEDYDCVCVATFTDGTRRHQLRAEDLCQSPGLAPLEAFKIMLRPRAKAAGAKTAAPAS